MRASGAANAQQIAEATGHGQLPDDRSRISAPNQVWAMDFDQFVDSRKILMLIIVDIPGRRPAIDW
jgi:hypothetical protein